MDFTKSELEQFGFEGFIEIGDLKERSGCSVIPREMGVYIVCRSKTFSPTYILKSGGYSLEKLQMNWVDGAYVLNIGKAGGLEYKTGLRKRISAYVRFGKMGIGSHKGGRAIWQLADSDDLLMAWRVLVDIEPAEKEQWLIDQFKLCYGRYPFANMRR